MFTEHLVFTRSHAGLGDSETNEPLTMSTWY